MILTMHQLLDYELVADRMSLVDNRAYGCIRFKLEVVTWDLLIIPHAVNPTTVRLDCGTTIFDIAVMVSWSWVGSR